MVYKYVNNSQLIRDLSSGDSKAYTFLMDTYQHRLCIYAFNLSHDQDQAEDIVQNVFLRIWKRRNNLKDDFSINSFLYKSVYNEFIDLYRNQKPFFPLEKKYIDEITSIIEDENQDSIQRVIMLMKEEIQKLPPKCKEVFMLSKQEGLTNIEIAEYKNVSIKAVEKHITTAFKILRESLNDKLDIYLFLLFGFRDKVVK